MNKIVRHTLIVAASAALAAGCAVTPEPITEEERIQRAAEDMEVMFADQEPLEGPVSLAEAMARAVKYNLDHRVKLFEQAVVRAETDVAQMNLLPDLAVAAGYTKRNNQAASSSQSVITGLQSLEPSTSQDRSRDLADATLVWNILDFGVGYVETQQRADRQLIAEERRRKSVQNIIQDVRVAYWQALSATTLAAESDELVAQTQAALERSRQLQDQGLQQPMVAMEYQERLLSTLRALLQLRQQLTASKTELASLMNVRPGTDVELRPDPTEVSIPEVNTALAELEEFGLLHRPELIEEDVRVRITGKEVKKAMLRMLPGLEIDLGAHYDSNSFLVNSDWTTAGIRISWNLMNIFTYGADKDRAEAQLEVDKTRRMATAMAVLTQVNVGYQRYLLAKKDYEIAEVLQQVKSDIAAEERVRRRALVSDDLTLIRSRLDALVAKLQRDQALAELQNAVGRIHNSIGLDPLPAEVTDYNVHTLATAIDAHQKKVQDMLVQPQMDPEAYDKIALEIKRQRELEEAEALRLAAIEAREQALADKDAAEAAAAAAAARRSDRAAEAERQAQEAAAAQQAAIEAALAEAEAKRLAEQAAAAEAARLAEEQAALEAARLAAEEAAAAATAASEQAAAAAAAAEEQRRLQQEQNEAAQRAAEEAAAARAAEAERIAAEVQAKLDAAVQAALGAGAAKKAADDAAQEAEERARQAEEIEIPEVPEPPAAGSGQSSGLYRAAPATVVETAPGGNAQPENWLVRSAADPAPVRAPRSPHSAPLTADIDPFTNEPLMR